MKAGMWGGDKYKIHFKRYYTVAKSKKFGSEL